VLYRYGVVLPPALGAVVMSRSTIIVAASARMISCRKKERRGTGLPNVKDRVCSPSATRQVNDEHEPLDFRR
jgi:hypothetical protein